MEGARSKVNVGIGHRYLGVFSAIPVDGNIVPRLGPRIDIKTDRKYAGDVRFFEKSWRHKSRTGGVINRRGNEHEREPIRWRIGTTQTKIEFGSHRLIKA